MLHVYVTQGWWGPKTYLEETMEIKELSVQIEFIEEVLFPGEKIDISSVFYILYFEVILSCVT